MSGCPFTCPSFLPSPFWASRGWTTVKHHLGFYYSHTKLISQANLLRSGIFWSFKRAQNMTHFWAWLNRWPIVKFLKTQESTIYRNNHDEYSCSPISNIMGNISTSFTISSSRTTCHRALSWAARKLRLRNFEMTDNNRSLIRTTIVLDRARFPSCSTLNKTPVPPGRSKPST